MGNKAKPVHVPAHPTHPRVDTFVVDPNGEMQVLVGTPTTGATLSNRLGAAPVPEGWQEADHYVLVRAAAIAITEADIAPNLYTRDLNAAVERLEREIADN